MTVVQQVSVTGLCESCQRSPASVLVGDLAAFFTVCWDCAPPEARAEVLAEQRQHG